MIAKLRKLEKDEDTTVEKNLLRPPSELLSLDEIEAHMEETVRDLYEDRGLIDEDDEIVVQLEP